MLTFLAVIGTVLPPPSVGATGPAGLAALISNVVKLMIMIGGLWTFLNLLLAGYQFLSANNDPKAITNAWAKIYQSLIGLVILAGSFLLAAVISLVIFGNPGQILNIVVYGPTP